MDIRAEIRRELEAAHAIATAAADANRGLTDDEAKTIEAHKAKVADLKQQLEAQESARQLAADLDAEIAAQQGAPAHQAPARTPAAAVPHRQDPPADPDARVQVRFTNRAEEKGDALGFLVVARYRFGQDQRSAEAHARKTYGERSPQMLAMQQSVFTAGGATIGENFVGAELIELLRAQGKIRKAGARTLPLVNGSATLPKITGGSTAYWGAEGDATTPSDLTTGQVVMTEKKLTAIVPVSNDLLKNSNIQVERLIRDDMVAGAANTEDLAFLRGDGLAGKPKGIYYWVGDAGRTDSAGTSLANIRTDVKRARNRLGNANAPKMRRAWLLHSRDITYVGTEIVDANSNVVWPQLANGEDGVLWNGGAVYEDNNIPTTLGSGDKSEAYFVEMSECFVGDSPFLELELFANATYEIGGSVRSGISRDESIVRLIRKTDFAMRHVESAHVTEAVGWGV